MKRPWPSSLHPVSNKWEFLFLFFLCWIMLSNMVEHKGEIKTMTPREILCKFYLKLDWCLRTVFFQHGSVLWSYTDEVWPLADIRFSPYFSPSPFSTHGPESRSLILAWRHEEEWDHGNNKSSKTRRNKSVVRMETPYPRKVLFGILL